MTEPTHETAQELAPPPERARTITDLARIAGVSPGTVSRALAGKSLVNAKTRERIEALAREHGFRLNQMASRLRRQKTGVIGVAIPLGHDRRQHISDAFFMTLLGYLADELTERGYDLMLRRVIPDRDGDWLDRFVGSGMVDGVIVIGQSDQFERIEAAAARFLPMVVWGNHQEGQRHCVVGSALPTHLSPEHAADEIAAHLASDMAGIDGIFAASDMLAIACMTELQKRGIDVPGGMKLVGFDDLPIASQTRPALTTIRQDIAAGAARLADLLLRRMGGENTASVVLPPELVGRQTA